MAKQSKRQLQVSQMIKRNASIVMMEEGLNIYGPEPLVSVTNVIMSPDLGLAKIYLSVYKTENKQAVLLLIEAELTRLKQALAYRIRKHIRRMPDIAFYIDETLDEMERLNTLFDKLHSENQMGEAKPE